MIKQKIPLSKKEKIRALLTELEMFQALETFQHILRSGDDMVEHPGAVLGGKKIDLYIAGALSD